MTGTQAKCFLSVSEHCNFSKAASALYVSQPAVSKQINSLERELGVQLFARQGKYIRLTQAGEIFRDFMLKHNEEYDAMLEHIRNLRADTRSGSINMGCCFAWSASHFYTPLSSHFSAVYPGIQLNVEALEPDELLPALRQREIDIAILYSATLERQTDIASVPFVTLSPGFICSAPSIPWGRENPGLRELEGRPFLIIDSPSEKSCQPFFSSYIYDLCRNEGFTPQFKRCRRMSSALMQVSCGSGVLLADNWYSAVSSSEIRYIPVQGKIDLCLAYMPTAPDSLISLFVSEALRVFGLAQIDEL